VGEGEPTTPERLRVIAHPLRWRLLEELGRSDRRVQDLTELLGEPQNLVSYHLRQLRTAGLVASRRSSADGRDAWYAVDLAAVRDVLAGAGAALHASLRLVPAPADPPGAARVLFLCTGNSARSQMAEALLEHRSGGRVRARSAGSHPKPLHPLAIRVMQDEYGLDLSGHRSKSIDSLRRQRFDRVVTLCDRVREVCPELPGQPQHAHWSIPDPAAGSSSDDAALPAFRQVAADLDARTSALLAALAP